MLAQRSLLAVELLPLHRLPLHGGVEQLWAAPLASRCQAFRIFQASLALPAKSSAMIASPAFLARSCLSNLSDERMARANRRDSRWLSRPAFLSSALLSTRDHVPGQTHTFSGRSLTSGFSSASTRSSNIASPRASGRGRGGAGRVRCALL